MEGKGKERKGYWLGIWYGMVVGGGGSLDM